MLMGLLLLMDRRETFQDGRFGSWVFWWVGGLVEYFVFFLLEITVTKGIESVGQVSLKV